MDKGFDPVAHMIDVEPSMYSDCSATEIKYAGIVSFLFWTIIALIFIIFMGWNLLIAPVTGFILAFVSAYFIIKWIGQQKRGKPHLYYVHKIEIQFLSKLRPSHFVQHVGVFGIGRTRR
ncbi:MAG: hypothetical protein DSZ28_06710 [Thiothrix sp.]|nr:MAG: hypothetical protein DSZ28_06710 [Thiothrix sp.]